MATESKTNSKKTKKKVAKPKDTHILHRERFSKISEWRKIQKEKVEREIARKKAIEENKRLMAQREVLRRIQIKQKREKQSKIRSEARKLKLQHEAKRNLIERKLEQKDEEFRKKLKQKQEQIAANQSVDPLDNFMHKLNREEQARLKKGGRKAKTKLSQKMANEAAKAAPKSRDPLRLKRVEILDNETQYEPKDLVVEEHVSWLDKLKPKKKQVKPVDHLNTDYIPFRRNFYLEAPEITSMTAKEVDTYRKESLEGVNIRGKNCPRPIFKWSQCGLPDKIYEVLSRHEYSEPFPIQCQAIPCLMSGLDVIACAKTGSGKTLAFILPMFRHILDQQAIEVGEGPIGLILSPTRELAKQIFAETQKFAVPLGLRAVCCHGGTTIADQIGELKRRAEIIVSTPGRMIDMLCVNSGRVTNTRRVTYLVLDEADRMFDMGFEPQIMSIVQNVRPDRQTALFSATFPKQVEFLVKQVMQRPVEIVIGGRSVASNTVVQTVRVLEEWEKFKALLKILGENYNKGQILIFTDRQEAVDRLFSELQKAGYFTLTLHGGMDQADRDSMVQDFKNKTRTILIATSIASRGLDIKDLNLVINYNVPNHYEDYVHRVGRTGRAGRAGYAITFISPDEGKYAPDLVKALKLTKHATIPQRLEEMAELHKRKVETGEGKSAPNIRASGSKGYRFDESEEYQKKLQKQRQEAVYGASASRNDSISEEALQRAAEESKAEQNAKSDKQRTRELLEKQLSAAKAGAAAIRTTINKAGRTHSAEEVNKLAQVAYQSVFVQSQSSGEVYKTKRGRAEAVAKSLGVATKLAALGANATPQKLANAIESRSFSRRLEVNDYPQQARYKVTSRQAIEQVREFSDVIVSVRGAFFAPGRNPSNGEEKLSLLIEGRTRGDVDRAYKDLRQFAEEAAQNIDENAGYGKYQVC